MKLTAGGLYGRILNSTETFDGSVWNHDQIENLPIPAYGLCVVKVNSSTLLSIGGKGNEDNLKNTFFYNLHVNKWTAGVHFINDLHITFALVDPESIKNAVNSSVSFYPLGIYGCKRCM